MTRDPISGSGNITKRQKITIITVSIVVALVVSELVLRTFAPIYLAGYIGAYQYDENLGVRTAPNVNHLRLTDHLQEFVTNARGTVNFFDDVSGWEKIVFTIGDSFTQGTGVSPDAAYPFQLDLALNAQNGAYQKQFAVINLGLGAYGLAQETIAARQFADTIGRPDYILQLGYGNDVEDDILFKSGYQHTQLVQGNPKWFGLGGELGWISERVEIIKRIKLAIGSFRRSQIQAAYEAAQGAPGATRTLASQLETQYFELKAVSDEFGAELIVSWAVCDDVVPGEGSYAWLKQWSANNGVAFADWCDTAMSLLASQPKLTLYNSHSGRHYRPWANRIIADAFAAEIHRAAKEPDADVSSPQTAKTP